MTLVEFGDGVHGQAPSSGSAIGVRYRVGARYSSVLLQQGRVVLDADGGEAPPVIACGIYRATVVENADPLVRDDRLLTPAEPRCARNLAKPAGRDVPRQRDRPPPQRQHPHRAAAPRPKPATPRTPVTSGDPTRQRPNDHERHFETVGEALHSGASGRHTTGRSAETDAPTGGKKHPAVRTRKDAVARGAVPFRVQGRLRHPATVHR